MKDWMVYNVLRDAAAKWPDNPAVHDEFGSLSFSGLFSQTESLKSQLKKLGIAQGMGVGVKAQNGRHFIMGIFAVLGCGATCMPMSHQLKRAEIDDILEETKLHAILSDTHGVQPFEDVDSFLPMEHEMFQFSFTGVSFDRPFASHVNQPAFMRFTSGTTGRSKGVLVSHPSVIERIEAANKALQLGPGDTVIWALPMAYHFIVSIVLYIRFGAAIAIARDFLAQSIIDITNERKGTMLYASPILIRLLASDTGIQQMSTLKKVISTSEGISLGVCKAFKDRFDLNVSQAYGIIEIGLPIINLVRSAEMPDAVGYALPDYEVVVLDEQLNPLPANTTGQLAIRGPGMFDAYLVPQRTRDEVLQNGYFLTADFASITEDGLIRVQGRQKSVINVSGSKVFPEEVEAVLQTIPGIKQARISSAPHPLLGQVIQAEVVLHEGQTIDEEAVLTYCRKRLSTFKIPQKLTIVDSLQMTGSGKIQRF